MDRQTYLITLENHLVSDDEIIRNFMLEILNRSFIGDESTFMIGLEANRKNRVKTQKNDHLKYLKNLPMPAEGVRQLLSDLQEDHADQASHYVSLLNHADPCLVEQFQGEISTILKAKGIKVADLTFYTDLCSDPRDIIFQKFQSVIRKMNAAEGFNQNYFILGKQMTELIVKRKLMGENEILYRLHKMKKRQKLSLSDLYDIVIAGDMKMEAAMSKLLVLLTLHSGDEVFSEEVVNALVKIGTNDVVDAVKPLVQERSPGRFHAIDVLSNIKTDYAKKTMIELFKKEPVSFEKTLIAVGLCEQFSTEAIPLIESYINEGYEAGLLPLEEYLYCNCIINGVNHSKLAEWKQVGKDIKVERLETSQISGQEKQELDIEEPSEEEETEEDTVESTPLNEEDSEPVELDIEEPSEEEQEREETVESTKLDEEASEPVELDIEEPLEEEQTQEETVESTPLDEEASEPVELDLEIPLEEEESREETVESQIFENVEEPIIQREDSEEQLAQAKEQSLNSEKSHETEDRVRQDEGKLERVEQNQNQEREHSPSLEELVSHGLEMDLATEDASLNLNMQAEENDNKRVEQEMKSEESEKIRPSQKRNRSNEAGQKVSNEELKAAMQRLINARNLSKTKKQQEKVGRNEPCPCGSGKKYKKCCL